MAKITLPDGSVKELEKDSTLKDLFGKEVFAAKLDGVAVDLSTVPEKDGKVEPITFESDEGKAIFWHSAAHVMAQAITRVFPNALLTIGPNWENGFYYDIDHEAFKPEDMKKISKEMDRIVNNNIKIEKKVLSEKEALELFKNNPYKIEMIKELEGEITAYSQGDFIDLCRGPHVPSTNYIKAFKLTKISGSYWRGDANNKSLQRIYGLAFPDKKQLFEYTQRMAEAEKRDHRVLGKRLELFSIHEESPGCPFFHPKGITIINELMDFWRDEHRKAGYKEIKTPLILNRKLWEQSGHWAHYKENMYFTKIDKQDFAVKPMNCPGAMLVYKNSIHSYRELPLRLAEMGIVHRHELSGVLAGLFRVRCFTQDDAHIFMTPDQISVEVQKLIDLIDRFYKTFGFDYHVELSTKPEKAMGAQKLWDDAENSLKGALKAKNIDFKLNPGDGAFYGPKIDFHVKDCIGRTWQCGTIQLDFQMPEKFDVTYEGEDGKKHMPATLHRVIYGSIERFLGILIEHYAGKFPMWLSPVQVRV
ncbi:MAG: threonine--tRNA ligase, partial [bacterium]|nr:threonine--tRNA ligase [bacterium]